MRAGLLGGLPHQNLNVTFWKSLWCYQVEKLMIRDPKSDWGEESYCVTQMYIESEASLCV